MTEPVAQPVPRIDPAKKTIVFFDFDGTLAEKDSLWPFLVAAAGWQRCLWAVVCGVGAYLTARCGVDRRTVIKDALLRHALKGLRVDALCPAIDRMRRWPRWLSSRDALMEHAKAGHHIVVATGSLNLYIEEMLGDTPHHAVLATEMEVKDGVLTGAMLSGNCVRQRKAERVASYMQTYGGVDESWAYGNAPHDLPMMELTTHHVII